ncbi:MAG: hypothetical protein PUE47_04985 [Lachnospiraceae bacterium]|nr:hypothetical protein [Lachnospiraceae bacterium]
MARFGSRRKSSVFGSVRTLVLASVLLIIFAISVRFLSGGNENRQRQNLERTLENDITACYALEGSYPESLDYLKKNYGLVYNEKAFYVDYRVTGTNIRPVVTVIRRK